MLQQPRTSALHTLSTVLCVVRVGSLCLNHPELVLKHPTHLAIAVLVWFVSVRGA